MKKPPFCIYSIRISNRETFTFLNLIVSSILDDPDLLTAFPLGKKDGTASDLSIYFKLPPRRHHLSSWLSSNEYSVKWSEHTCTDLGKTILAIGFIEASCISFLSSQGILIGNIFVQFWLIWTAFHTASDHFCFFKSSLC